MTLTNYSGKQWFDWINVKIDKCFAKLNWSKKCNKNVDGKKCGLQQMWVTT